MFLKKEKLARSAVKGERKSINFTLLKGCFEAVFCHCAKKSEQEEWNNDDGVEKHLHI